MISWSFAKGLTLPYLLTQGTNAYFDPHLKNKQLLGVADKHPTETYAHPHTQPYQYAFQKNLSLALILGRRFCSTGPIIEPRFQTIRHLLLLSLFAVVIIIVVVVVVVFIVTLCTGVELNRKTENDSIKNLPTQILKIGQLFQLGIRIRYFATGEFTDMKR